MACRFSSLRLAMTTLAPASARRWAMALPMPRPPPVTRATLPAREIVADMAHSVHSRYSASSSAWYFAKMTPRRIFRLTVNSSAATVNGRGSTMNFFTCS